MLLALTYTDNVLFKYNIEKKIKNIYMLLALIYTDNHTGVTNCCLSR